MTDVRRWITWLPAAVGLLVAAPAEAQWKCEDLKAPPPGSWVEWQTSAGGPVTLALVDGTAGTYRYEVVSTASSPGPAVFQAPLPGYPPDPKAATEVVFQLGANPPMRLTGPMLQTMQARIGAFDLTSMTQCQTFEDLGAETVPVGKTTIQTRHFRDPANRQELWLSGAVPFGLVKRTGPDGTVVLVQFGTGYSSKLTGTPIDMPAMPRRP